MLSIFLKEKKYSELTIYLLIVILPFTLVSGPFLSDLSISLITIIFIYITLKKKTIFLLFQQVYKNFCIILFIFTFYLIVFFGSDNFLKKNNFFL